MGYGPSLPLPFYFIFNFNSFAGPPSQFGWNEVLHLQWQSQLSPEFIILNSWCKIQGQGSLLLFCFLRLVNI